MTKNKGVAATPKYLIKGFTLIELLVVVMIIMALAGLIVGGAQQARKRALIAKVKAAIASLETALSMYETDAGEYPAGDISDVVTALTTDQSDDTWTWRGPYMMFKTNDLSGGNFIDPWGRAYEYDNPGEATRGHNNYVDIYSKGPDGTGDGTGDDDINNW